MPSSKPPVRSAAGKPTAAPRAGVGSSAGVSSSADEADQDWLSRLLGRNVRQVRNHRRLSQEALADLAGVDRTYVSGIERKGRNVSIHTVQRLSEALQIDPQLLLDASLITNPEFGGDNSSEAGPEAARALPAASNPTRRG